MKIFLTFITVLLFSHCTVCQILTIKDFNKLYNYSNPDDHSFLLNKGFLLSTDTVNIKKEDAFVKYYAYSFKKLNPREMLAVSYTKYKEGGYNFEVNYFVASVTAYKKFIASLKRTKFKFSKRRQLYTIFASSYSGETLQPKGQTVVKGKKYYRIQYTSYEGKELSLPIQEPIMQADTTVSSITP